MDEAPALEPASASHCSRSESDGHRLLKRLSLSWAQERGFRIAAVEVSVPSLGCCRLDAAAYRPEEARGRDPATGRAVPMPRVGITALFECKVSRGDFLRDSRRERWILERLERLYEQRSLYESSMQTYFPSLRQGEALFPEFDGYRFEEAGFQPYDSIQARIRLLSRRLHSETKFDRLFRWKAANLHYLVVEAGVAQPHEIPPGWGLLLREGDRLQTKVDAVWQDAPEHQRWELLHRIALCGTRAVNRSLDVKLGTDARASPVP